jgi:hypothetical protein
MNEMAIQARFGGDSTKDTPRDTGVPPFANMILIPGGSDAHYPEEAPVLLLFDQFDGETTRKKGRSRIGVRSRLTIRKRPAVGASLFLIVHSRWSVGCY